MGEDLSVGVKIGISMTVVVFILMTILLILTLGRRFAGDYIYNMNEKVAPKYDYDVKALSYEEDAVPVPSIYSALLSYGMGNLAQFDLEVNGNNSTNPEDLTKYFSEKFYVEVVETTDGLHVWVGDTR